MPALWKERRITTNDATTARTIKKAGGQWRAFTRAWDIEDHVPTVPTITMDATILRT